MPFAPGWPEASDPGPPAAIAALCASAASGGLHDHPAIAIERAADIVEQAQFAIDQDGATVAILPGRAAVMGDEDDVGIPRALAKRRGAFSPKPVVADFGNLVDQISIEIDSQTGSKGKTRLHAR